MGYTKSYSSENTTRVCTSSLDDQVLHGIVYMALKGKAAIVPGLQVVTTEIATMEDFLLGYANSIDMHFSSFTSVGELVIPNHTFDPKKMEVRLSVLKPSQTIKMAENENEEPFKFEGRKVRYPKTVLTDILCDGENYTRISTKERGTFEPKPILGHRIIQPEIRGGPITPEQVQQFASAIDCQDPRAALLLYAIGRSSIHLLDTIRNPRNLAEQNITTIFDDPKGRKLIPVYQTIKINIEEKGLTLERDNTIGYRIESHRVGTKRRQALYITQCMIGGVPIFNGSFLLTPATEKIILRKALPLSEKEQQKILDQHDAYKLFFGQDQDLTPSKS